MHREVGRLGKSRMKRPRYVGRMDEDRLSKICPPKEAEEGEDGKATLDGRQRRRVNTGRHQSKIEDNGGRSSRPQDNKIA